MTTDINNDDWKCVQVKTFTKWINNKLSTSGYGTIKDVFSDCRDGIALINLLQGITGLEIQHNTSANTKYTRLENNQFLIQFLERSNLQVVNIRPSDLVEGNQKLLLGLIWIIILRFGVSGLSEESTNSKKALLAWCRAVTEPYSNVNVKDFSGSWKDGLAFNAIIHRFRPDIAGDYWALRSDNALYNIKRALEMADAHFDIPKLFDAEDISGSIMPDEKSVFTYVSQYYNTFTQLEKRAAAARRVSELLKKINWSLKSRHEYERMASQFLDMKKCFERDEDELRSILNALTARYTKRKEMAFILNNMFLGLKSLYGNIEAAHFAYKIRAYQPPDPLRIDRLDCGVYDADLSKLEESKALFDILNSHHEYSVDRKAEAVEVIKRLFDYRKDIDQHVRDLRSRILERDFSEIKELLEPSEITREKIKYLESMNEEVRGKKAKCKKAVALFQEYDKLGQNKIHLNDFVKCLKSLDLDCSMSQGLEKKITEDSSSFFTLEEYVESIGHVLSDELALFRFKKDVMEFTTDSKISVNRLGIDPADINFISDNSEVIDLKKVIEEFSIH